MRPLLKGSRLRGVSTGPAKSSPSALQFQRLAQENVTGYLGIFQYPAQLYKELLASEGHRHYPLRAVKPLRRAAELMLPLSLSYDHRVIDGAAGARFTACLCGLLGDIRRLVL